jgi:hypothetical protein
MIGLNICGSAMSRPFSTRSLHFVSLRMSSGLTGGERFMSPDILAIMGACRGFSIAVAGRTLWGDSGGELRAGFQALFAREHIPLDATDRSRLLLFPEMDETMDVPEITTACWGIRNKVPASHMCATSRMAVKRKGAPAPVVAPCTPLPTPEEFELGATLAESFTPVPLNHRHCAGLCILGGGSCSN